MSEKYFPFRSVSGDRKYSAEDWAAYFALFISNGVFYSSADKLKVVVDNGMQIKVNPGAAFINGRGYRLEEELRHTLDMADGVLSRIDRIVLRCDYTKRLITIAVKKGSYSERPTAPEITRNADVYEMALADIYVAAGIVAITNAAITDQRLNKSLCGIATGLVDQADTTEIFNQFTAYMQEFKQSSQTDFEDWEEEQQQAFEEWVEEIKGILSEEAAGNLLEMINTIKSDLTNTVPYNLIDTNITSSFVRGSGTYESGSVTVTKTSTGGQAYFCKDYFLKKGVSYTVSAKCETEETESGSIAVLYVLDESKLNFEVLVGSNNGSDVSVTFTPAKEHYCIRVMFRQHNAAAPVGTEITFTEMQLVEGTEVKPFRKPFDSTYELSEKLATAYEDTFSQNIIPFPYYAPSGVETSGVKWTYDENGIITANGKSTATNASTLYVCRSLLLKAGTYTISGCPNGGSDTTYRIRIGKDDTENTLICADTGEGVTFTLKEDTTVTIIPQIFSGYTATNVQFRPMLVKGSVKKPFRKHFDSTYELSEKLAVAYEDTFPQNLIPFPYHEDSHTDNGIEWTVNEDGTVVANKTATSSSEFTISPRLGGNNPIIVPAGTYTVTGCPAGGSSSTYNMNVLKTSDSGTNERVAVDYGNGVTFTLDKETKLGVNFYVMNGQTVNNLIFKPMLVKGSVAKLYHRYFKSLYEMQKEPLIEISNSNAVTEEGIAMDARQANPEIAGSMAHDIATLYGNLGGCWVAFEDAEGNPTDEPYIHWLAKED